MQSDMKKITAQQCIDAITKKKCFHAEVEDGAFEIKIDEYSQTVCTAIHEGHHIRSDIVDNCALSEAERLYEEDPYTGDMIANMPIVIRGRDSRYEYDLNRPPADCVYEEAWGKPVWNKPLSQEEKETSLNKHHTFYRVLGVLYQLLQDQYGTCLVYDVHSYNYKRIEHASPLFNVGTEQLNPEWSGMVDHWVNTLNAIALPSIECRAAANEVFYGRGYHATFVRDKLDNTLLLPTEVKKIFMDELTGQVDTQILAKIQHSMTVCCKENAEFFARLKK